MNFRIYVDVASFFDFRLAAMLKRDQEIKFKIAELWTEYTRRDHDDLQLIFHTIPPKLDTTPTKELLRNAPITDVDSLIRDDILAYVNRPDVTVKHIELTVDFQGIVLSEKENEVFLTLISSRFDHAVKVNLVSNSRLNLRKVDARYDLAIVYDTNGRIMKEMTKPNLRLKNCNVQTPFRFLDGSVEAAREFQRVASSLPYKERPDEVLKEQLLAVMPLHFVEMEYFCVKQL